jgi:hypothetical protein
VADRTSGTSNQALVDENGTTGNRIGLTSANTWRAIGGTSGTLNATANDAAWHAGQFVVNGASSVINIDGTETTGTVTGNTAAGAPIFTTAVSGQTVNHGEGGFIDNVAISSSVRTNLCHNQYLYWGTVTSC